MRQIKFRGKRHNGEWVYGSVVYSSNSVVAIHYEIDTGAVRRFDWCYVDPDTVGQFTGLYDENGKEIYEGDIVKCGEFVYKVIYKSRRIASFALSRKQDVFVHYFGEAMEADECEVIGNIYDNPEILKE